MIFNPEENKKYVHLPHLKIS